MVIPGKHESLSRTNESHFKKQQVQISNCLVLSCIQTVNLKADSKTFCYIDTDEIPGFFPVTKIWYPVKTQFLSFTCEDITVVMVTSVSAHRKRASQHLAIVVYIINRILHARLWICILSSTREISSWTREDKIRIHVRSCNILYFFGRPSTPEQSCLRALEFCVLHFSFSINGELTKGDSAHRVPTFLNNIFPQGCKT